MSPPPPRSTVPLRTVLLASTLLVTVLLTTVLVLAPRRPEPALLAVPPEREAALQARILTLQRELAELSEEVARAPDAEREEQLRRQVDEMTATIRNLELQLDASSGATAGPVFPPTTPTPARTATPTDPPRPTPSRDAPRSTIELPTPQLPAPSPVVAPPTLVTAVRPTYPQMALRLRREASVELRVLVDADGRVRQVEPVGAPSGFGFDQAAREAALTTQYRPGTRDGVPVQMETTLVVRFRLDQR